ncbi:carbohydrate esterase family 3 protein [Viridothelium virens]|uniref:Carbohydrate esterase family 3 protein n=1 Tax=Viridothelium virens TaxID=1048519 RepID=A0A6A6HNF0_VIRVR|nr:carbohydrate esterase family 3 protein [Viridothelium virens]
MFSFKHTAALLALLSLASAQSRQVRYMPFGDSITEITCWRGLLQQQFNSSGLNNVLFVGSENDQNPAGCPVTNYNEHNEGHSGFQAVNIANQNQLVGWLQQNPADVITMHLGTNDIALGGQSTSNILAAFTKLVGQMRASNANMKIIVAQIIPISIASSNSQNVALNAAIPAWAQGLNSTASPIYVVDQYTGFNAATDLRDGVHPNASGDQKMAAKWFPALVTAINLAAGSTKREIEFEA